MIGLQTAKVLINKFELERTLSKVQDEIRRHAEAGDWGADSSHATLVEVRGFLLDAIKYSTSDPTPWVSRIDPEYRRESPDAFPEALANYGMDFAPRL